MPTEDNDIDSKGHGEFAPGDIVDGAYEIESFIGAGGMGNVYRVRHKILGTEYALKTLSADRVTEVAWRRFQVEAQAIARMSHPNIVGIYNLGLHDGKIPFYVMDILTGATVADLIARDKYLEIERAIAIFLEVCAGIDYAHKKGIVHRDIKPGNIVVLDKPDASGATVKIVDFGIAKLSHTKDLANQQLTGMGEICGSPFYMSPEQCQGGKIDARSDTYSLGCTLFQSLTGSPPFKGRNAVETMMMHQTNTPPTLSAVAGAGRKFPRTLEAILAKTLAKAPMDRYQTTEHLARDLQAVLSNRAATTETEDESPQKSNTNMTPYMIMGAVVLVLLTASAVVMATRPQPPAPLVKTAVATDNMEEPARARVVAIDGPPFATPTGKDDSGKPLIVFKFPADVNLGQLIVAGKRYGCRGSLPPVPAGTATFAPTAYVLEHPEIMKRFGPNDLKGLIIDTSGTASATTDIFTTAVFRHFVHLKGLTHLSFAECSKIDDGIIDLVDQLPRLIVLDTRDSNISLAKLSRSATIHRLSNLTLASNQNLTPFLLSLHGNRSLRFLDLPFAIMSAEDVRALAEIPNLVYVKLARSSLTDEDLVTLSRLKLEVLRCRDDKFTHKAPKQMLAIIDASNKPPKGVRKQMRDAEQQDMREFAPTKLPDE